MAAPRKMHLVAYLKTAPTASYAGGWRYPGAPLDDIWEPSRYEHLARMLEAARFDAGFFADSMGVPDIYKNSFADYLGRGGQMSLLDPMMVLPLMAAVTTRLGLGSTLSTTFNGPYHLARSLGSLDLLSKGRAAWNVVTSATDYEARNCGMDDLPPKEARYDRADDVLAACFALWDCWDEDAVVLDREAGVFADASKVHYANYVGPYVRTRGPMSIRAVRKGRPVIMQAGSSPRGRAFSARWAELIFCSHATKADAVTYRNDILERVVACGRSPEDCRVLPSLSVVVGETESIAREKADYLDSRVDPELVLASSSGLLGVDLSTLDTAEAAESAAGNQGIQGSRDRMTQVAAAQGISFGPGRAQAAWPDCGHPGDDRRHHGGLVQGRCMRRFRAAADGVPGHVRGVRPDGGAGIATARPVSPRICRAHPAGEPGEPGLAAPQWRELAYPDTTTCNLSERYAMPISRRLLIGSSIALSAVRSAHAAASVLRIGIGTSLNTLDPMLTTIGDEYIYDNLVFNGLDQDAGRSLGRARSGRKLVLFRGSETLDIPPAPRREVP